MPILSDGSATLLSWSSAFFHPSGPSSEYIDNMAAAAPSKTAAPPVAAPIASEDVIARKVSSFTPLRKNGKLTFSLTTACVDFALRASNLFQYWRWT